MARRRKPRAKPAPKRIPVRAIDGSDLCLQCGLCCDGTLFTILRLPKEGDHELAESVGLTVEKRPDEPADAALLPCPAFLDGCCSVYTRERPSMCGDYRCRLLIAYTAGQRNLDELLPIVHLVRNLTRELAVEMGIPGNEYTRRALWNYLADATPWVLTPETLEVSPEHVRFVTAFHRFSLLAQKYFEYEPQPVEVQTARLGAHIDAGDVPATMP